MQNSDLDAKPHQREGVEWILNNETSTTPLNNVRGGLIADEMGLGKTILMIGTIVANELPRTLIVVPVALLEQWEREITRFTSMTPLVWHGSQKKHIELEELCAAKIVITSYGHIQEASKKRPITTPLHQIPWDRVVFDEAHHLRNPGTKKHLGAKKIKAPIRWLITGTPIQNRKSDFYSLCAIMGYEKTFYTNADNLMPMVRASILKRTKEEVGIELPPLKEQSMSVKWKSEAERDLAEDLHHMLSFSALENERQVNGAIEAMGNTVLPLMVRARQSCILPSLMEKFVKDATEMGLLEEDDSIYEAMKQNSKIDSLIETIGKRAKNGRGKIIFCHYRGEIDMIHKKLTSELDLDVAIYDGRVNASDRAVILTETHDVLLLQIMTGCEGINLQHYSEIYFVSPHWNPAIEDQAVARCHRIGQTQPVEVFRFKNGKLRLRKRNQIHRTIL